MNITMIVGVVAATLLIGIGVESWALKSAWQREAATKQALAQAAQSLKDMHDAAKERTGIDTGCSGLSIDDLLKRLHDGTACR